MPGMRRSSSTTSGEVCRTSGSTSAPEDVAPTISMSGASASAMRMPSSMSSWSSAIRSLSRMKPPSTDWSGVPPQHLPRSECPGFGRRVNPPIESTRPSESGSRGAFAPCSGADGLACDRASRRTRRRRRDRSASPALASISASATSTGKRLAVRLHVRHRVERVDDGEDPRGERDLARRAARAGSRCRPTARGGTRSPGGRCRSGTRSARRCARRARGARGSRSPRPASAGPASSARAMGIAIMPMSCSRKPPASCGSWAARARSARSSSQASRMTRSVCAAVSPKTPRR